ncbi:hypothetical protein PICSAR254_02668 [Mycobacterium avium subsp. paratuberculosis]|nr:hypothetical protein PICSAR22_02979 [Mycobacterium avium subsp. paratuberculosis]CAG7226827.1 hypothetical protein PICSAR254_02668 [Mycobacterium avium subsp. paratuberculosis]CAG7233684.1 hypothetical protein PICSAR255_02885 [Mycobacterium avium subsp. paratuberculosis]
MMSTMLPLPLARIRLIPESCPRVWRSFSPLPSSALAAVVMKRLTDVDDTSLAGPRSVASLVNCSVTWSHSTGIAVRSVSITAPSSILGPPPR